MITRKNLNTKKTKQKAIFIKKKTKKTMTMPKRYKDFKPNKTGRPEESPYTPLNISYILSYL